MQTAEQVVEAARTELEGVQGRLLRLRAAREIAAEADAVVRERAGQVPHDAGAPQAGQVKSFRNGAPSPICRCCHGDYPKIATLARKAGPEGIRAV